MSIAGSDVVRARAVVESIADSHGHLGEEVLGTLSPEIRRKIERAMRKKDEMSASSILTYV